MSYSHVPHNLNDIWKRIVIASAKAPSSRKVTLVAVSKLHPKEAIIEAYSAGQKTFGENYVQELFEKASDPEVLSLCPGIEWHFIGHLQTNKVNKLVSVPNLRVVQTVDSEKLASSLDKAWSSGVHDFPLKIFVQVNTSGEENKSGVHPLKTGELVEFVLKSCPNLQFAGLMTIGAFDHDPQQGQNPDFLKLLECRDNLNNLGLDVQNVEISMGMSSDFEQAIEMGSTTIRVGTTIFGARPSKT